MSHAPLTDADLTRLELEARSDYERIAPVDAQRLVAEVRRLRASARGALARLQEIAVAFGNVPVRPSLSRQLGAVTALLVEATGAPGTFTQAGRDEPGVLWMTHYVTERVVRDAKIDLANILGREASEAIKDALERGTVKGEAPIPE